MKKYKQFEPGQPIKVNGYSSTGEGCYDAWYVVVECYPNGVLKAHWHDEKRQIEYFRTSQCKKRRVTK